jgi:PAS domain S-box-containing protein
MVLRPDGRITEWSPEAVALFGWQEKEALGQHLSVLVHPKHRARLQDVWEGVTAGRVREDSNQVNVRQDGRSVVCDWTYLPVRSQRRRLVGIAAVAQVAAQEAEEAWVFRREVQRLRDLLREAVHLSGVTDLQEVLVQVLKAARRMVGAHYAALGVVKKRTKLDQFIPEGMTEEEIAAIDHWPEGRGLLGATIKEGQVIRVPSISEDPRSVGFPPGHPIMTSFLGVPIVAHNEILGHLYLTDKAGGEDFTDEDERLANLLAEVAALAISNANTRQSLDQRVRELEVGSQVIEAILATTDLEERLRTILEEVTKYLDVEYGGIYLVHTKDLVLRVSKGFSDDARIDLASYPKAKPPKWLSEFKVVNNPREAPGGRLPRIFGRIGIRSYASVPLRVVSQDEPIGVLLLASRRPDAFTESEVRTINAMSRVLAVGIDHAGHFRDAQQRLHRLEVLRDIDRAIIQHRSLRDVLEVVLEKVPVELGADAVAVSLIDPEQTRPRLFIMRQPNGTVIEEEAFALSESLLHWFVERQEPVIIYDISKDPRVQTHRERLRNGRLASYLGVPLLVREQTIGILHILTTRPTVFGEEDVEFFRTMAGQAAIGIENARMYEETLQRAEALEAMVESEAIMLARPDRITEELLGGLCRVVNNQNAAYFEFDPVTKKLVLTQGSLSHEEAETGPVPPFTLGQEEGLVGLVAHTRYSLHVSDCTQNPHISPFCQHVCPHRETWMGPNATGRRENCPEPRSFLFVPVHFSGRLFGVVVLWVEASRGISLSQRALVDLFIHHAASALENARLLAETRSQAEQLRQAEARYRDLFDNAPDGYHATDPDQVFLEMNETELKWLGYRREEVVGKMKIDDILTPAGRELVAAARQGFRRRGWIENLELEYVRKDGTTFPVRINATAVYDRKGKYLMSRATVRDITREQHLLRQLLGAQRMESIGRLAGGVAHDFNNLLTGILGYAQMGSEMLSAEDPSYDLFVEIEKTAERAASLTRQLLAYSRQQVLEPKIVNLNIVVADITKLIQRVIGEDVNLKIYPSTGLEAVFADPNQVEQVLLNLCLNARDAMPEGGELVISTRNVDIGDDYVARHPWAKPGRYVQVSVSDTGLGMDAVTRERVFEPFFTTKEVGKGTGLGLSVAYGIIKQHNGYIDVDSELGRGTTFNLYFPVYEAEVEEEEVLAQPRVRGGRETLLLAEDEDVVRNMSERILSGLGYTVLVATDGEEAVRIFSQRGGDVHLVILDLVMPQVGGLEAWKRMSEIRPDLPVLFVTGYSAEMAEVNRARTEGVEILQKPYGIGELARKVRELLDQV